MFQGVVYNVIIQAIYCPPPPASWVFRRMEGWVDLKPATWACWDQTQVLRRVFIATMQFNHCAMRLLMLPAANRLSERKRIGMLSLDWLEPSEGSVPLLCSLLLHLVLVGGWEIPPPMLQWGFSKLVVVILEWRCVIAVSYTHLTLPTKA